MFLRSLGRQLVNSSAQVFNFSLQDFVGYRRNGFLYLT